MPPFSIRDATDADLPGIVDLYFRVEDHPGFSRDDCAAWWRWLVPANPNGVHKSLVALDGSGGVVGHYAIVPFRFRTDGVERSAGFLCWLQVDEAFRKELVFPRLELTILKDYPPLGMAFAYGLITRPHVLKAHFAFGFKEVGRFPVMARPLNAGKILAEMVPYGWLRAPARLAGALAAPFLSLFRSRPAAGIQIAPIERFDATWDEPLATIGRAFPLAAVRTPAILNWRFVDYRGRGYRILAATEKGAPCGYAVIRRMTMKQFDVAALVDLHYDPARADIGRSLLRAVLDEAARMRSDLCTGLFPPESPMQKVLRENLFLATPEGFTLIVHEPKGSEAGVKERPPTDWHLTWFDHDFV